MGNPDGLDKVIQALKPALASVALTPPELPRGLAGIPIVPFGPSAGITVLGFPVDTIGGRECLRGA